MRIYRSVRVASRIRAFCLTLCLAALALIPPLPCGANEENPQIERLNKALRTSANPDSVRLALAIVYRNLGTTEGRLHAMDLFEKIRTRYYDVPEYHLEIARTYFESGSYRSALEEIRRAIANDRDEVVYRVISARFLLPSVIRYRDLQTIREALGILDEALARAPADRDALFFKSVYLCLLSNLGMTARVENSTAARACTEEILSRNARDLPACLLNGVNCMDLGDAAEADYSFRLGLTVATDEIKVRYFMPRWSAPDSTLARIETLPPDRRVPAVEAYWDGLDPTPLTPVNEALLEYWKRLTLADLMFGRPEEGVHGWDTPRGEVLVRYGMPMVMRFEAARIDGGEATWREDERLNLRIAKIPGMVTMPFISPTQTWRYRIGDRVVDIAFVDSDLRDDFQPRIPAFVDRLRRTVVSTPAWVSTGGIKRCYVTTAGLRGRNRAATRQSLVAAIPPWESAPDWWRDGACRISLVDSASRRTTLSETPLASILIREPLPGVPMAVISADADIPAGRYSGIVEVDCDDRHATFTFPVDVRRFDTDTLLISDLRLALRGIPTPVRRGMEMGTIVIPNPTESVLAGDDMDVYFEVYNLRSDPSGTASYQTRYTLLPRRYAVEYARLLAAGAPGIDPSSRLGGLGRTLGGVTLTQANYADVLFPPTETRVSEGGRGTASIRLEKLNLEPGPYALIVTVRDLGGKRVAQAQTPLMILSESDRIRLIGSP